jgi:hypothetical protein
MIEDITQQEKREVLRNDQRVREASTYHSVAQASIDDERGGRFAQSGSSTTVTGSGPISYPQQPPGSPWANDPLPSEPLIDGTGEGNVLGYAIDGSPSTPAASDVEGESGGLKPGSATQQPMRRRV